MDVYEHIRPSILRAIDQYVQHGRLPGQFLQSVLSNDLREAITRADPESLAALREIVVFLYNEVPSPAWGSRDAMLAWSTRGGAADSYYYVSDEARERVTAVRKAA